MGSNSYSLKYHILVRAHNIKIMISVLSLVLQGIGIDVRYTDSDTLEHQAEHRNDDFECADRTLTFKILKKCMIFFRAV